MNKKRSKSHEEALEQFILLWGEMASAWGINKTMAQIHALLYAEAEPLDTDFIMHRLDISRGNANMNLRRLVQWQLAHKVPIEGKRKDFYTAEKDIWSIVATIIQERQEREVAPIRANLEECLEGFEAKKDMNAEEEAFRERIEIFIDFLGMFERFIDALLPYIDKKNIQFLKQLVKLTEMKENMKERITKADKQGD